MPTTNGAEEDVADRIRRAFQEALRETVGRPSEASQSHVVQEAEIARWAALTPEQQRAEQFRIFREKIFPPRPWYRPLGRFIDDWVARKLWARESFLDSQRQFRQVVLDRFQLEAESNALYRQHQNLMLQSWESRERASEALAHGDIEDAFLALGYPPEAAESPEDENEALEAFLEEARAIFEENRDWGVAVSMVTTGWIHRGWRRHLRYCAIFARNGGPFIEAPKQAETRSLWEHLDDE
jgi:hypothetical protein